MLNAPRKILSAIHPVAVNTGNDNTATPASVVAVQHQPQAGPAIVARHARGAARFAGAFNVSGVPGQDLKRFVEKMKCGVRLLQKALPKRPMLPPLAR